jgi:hypothetical protein
VSGCSPAPWKFPARFVKFETQAGLSRLRTDEQRLILAKWAKEVVFEMGATCIEAERPFAVPLKDVLKPGYESFERPQFDRGSCCELLH